MSSASDSLHRILKDENRRKIIMVLNEKGNLGYTDLMKAVGIDNTGKFNYHLKILSGLIVKKDDGLYALTEKGLLASRLMRQFPENTDQLRLKSLRQTIWIGLALQVIYVTAIVVLYFFGVIDTVWLIRGISFLLVFIVGNYLIYRTQRTRSNPDSSEDRTSMKIVYTAGGVGLGVGIAFFGVLILSRIIQHFLGIPYLYALTSSEWFFFFSLVIAPSIGGLIGYWFGQRRGFKRFELKILGYRL
jgi:hypothetical protein